MTSEAMATMHLQSHHLSTRRPSVELFQTNLHLSEPLQ